MGILLGSNHDDDDSWDDDGPMFGASERYERRKEVLRRAKEIESGLTSGLSEKDEEVWAMVKKLKGD